MKERWNESLKKVYFIQYITLVLSSIILITFPTICILACNILEPGAHADGMLMIALWFIAGISVYTVVPIGVITVIISTIAFIFNRKSKRKIARALNRISIVIIILIALVISMLRVYPIAILLWSIIAFNIYLTNKVKDLQKQEEQLIEQNIYEENINSES